MRLGNVLLQFRFATIKRYLICIIEKQRVLFASPRLRLHVIRKCYRENLKLRWRQCLVLSSPEAKPWQQRTNISEWCCANLLYFFVANVLSVVVVKLIHKTFSKDKTLAKVFQKVRLAPNAPSLFLVHFIRNHTYGDLLVLQLLTEIQKRLSIFSFWVSSKKLVNNYLLVPILLVCSEIIGKHLSQRFYQFLVNSILF